MVTVHHMEGKNSFSLNSIQCLLDHKLCALEWDTLKQCTKISYFTHSFHNFILKLATGETFIIHYPSLSKLTEIILIYPLSTTQKLRGFSYQNVTKTKLHNRLNPSHLDQLLRLQLNAAQSLEFPFHVAYKHWVEAKHHRNVIPQPSKEKLDIKDSGSESSGSKDSICTVVSCNL